MEGSTTTTPQRIEIGPAVLWLGDSLALLAQGALAFDAILTDPPYGIGYKHGARGVRLGVTHTDPIPGDDRPFDPGPWLRAAGDRPVMLFGADHYKERLPPGGRFVCWDKSCGMGAAAQFVDAEFAWTNRRNPRAIYRHFWMGAMREGDPVLNAREGRLHLAQKPVELMMWCLEHMRVDLGKQVLDPYMGSGSTGVACLLAGRRFVGVEIDPATFETARARIAETWARMTASERGA